MNLNPLKKDDNTDALVKALEDANNMGGAQPTPDGTAVVADPQVVSSGMTPPIDSMTSNPATSLDPLANITPAMGTAPDSVASIPDPGSALSADSTTVTPDASSSDSSSSIAFSGNDLPEGLSSDADAHLPTGGTGDNAELDTVKNSALEQLRPLIEKLDLEPADKFDKYLMMLRASDDAALIKPAFDAAQGIEGEKEKAQALLDIINEINYITANQQQS